MLRYVVKWQINYSIVTILFNMSKYFFLTMLNSDIIQNVQNYVVQNYGVQNYGVFPFERGVIRKRLLRIKKKDGLQETIDLIALIQIQNTG